MSGIKLVSQQQTCWNQLERQRVKSLVKIWNTDIAGTPMVLESFSHIAWRSSSRASATSFTLLSSVDVLGLSGLGSLSMLTQPPWKQLAQQETVVKVYCELTTNFTESIVNCWGFLPCKVLILLYDLWPEIVTAPDTLAYSIPSSCGHTIDTVSTHASFSSLQLQMT